MILLDTHVLIWLAEGVPRLGARARERIAAEGGYVSSITFWEVANLASRGRGDLSADASVWLDAVRERPELRPLPLTDAQAQAAPTLPGRLHRDPADRFLIAQARDLRCSLMTADRAILDYAAAGHVTAIDARR